MLTDSHSDTQSVAETRSPWWKTLVRQRTSKALSRLEHYFETLSPGDTFIAYALFGVVALTGLVSVFALERSLLVEVPVHGGSLVEGVLGSPRFVNPLLAITDADRDLAALTYAGLLGLAGDGTLRPVLAESYTVSEDGREYTVTLRADARFSDETPVTAQDVAFTVTKAQDPTLKSPVYADWAGVTVEAVDARTVRFTLAKPYAPFVENLTLGILPARLWGGIGSEEFPFSRLQTEPVGAGPYTVSRVERDASGLITSYTLRSNPEYALGEPYLDRIKLIFFPRLEDLAAALKKGAIESAYGVPGMGSLETSYARIFGIFFNSNQTQILTRIEVRKALSLAVHRTAIVEESLGGYAAPIMGPVPPGSGIIDTPVPGSENPTADAAAVLTRAGWEYDSEARAWKNGKLTIEPLTIKTSNVPELKAIAAAVKGDWERLGIPTDIELYEPGDLSQNVIRPRKYSALLFGMVIDGDQDLYAFWHSQERNDPGLNIALYVNKTVDDLLEEARKESDPEKRLAILQKINDTIAGEYPAVFIESPDFVYTVPETLSGVALPQIATPRDRFAGVESWYRKTEKVWPIFTRSGVTSQ